MKFEHLVAINDLSNPAIPVISRAELWRGLVLRAEMPKLFIPYLDDALIEDRTEVSMQRRLRYGELVVTDTVTLTHQQHVHYDVPAQGEIPTSTMRMTIEEPQPLALFVRFVYDDHLPDSDDAEQKMMNDYRRSAYQAADVDTVSQIRQLAESGQLDGHFNG